jgi:hypothetical protein
MKHTLIVGEGLPSPSEREGDMRHRSSSYRRRTLYGGLFVALVALAVPVSEGTAGADPSSRVSVPIAKHVFNCGLTLGKKVIGKATFSRSGDTLGVTVKLNGADPGGYDVFLFDGTTCVPIAVLGKFRVDASGHGSKTGYADVTGSHEFFVDAFKPDTETDNTSLIASI